MIELQFQAASARLSLDYLVILSRLPFEAECVHIRTNWCTNLLVDLTLWV